MINFTPQLADAREQEKNIREALEQYSYDKIFFIMHAYQNDLEIYRDLPNSEYHNISIQFLNIRQTFETTSLRFVLSKIFEEKLLKEIEQCRKKLDFMLFHVISKNISNEKILPAIKTLIPKLDNNSIEAKLLQYATTDPYSFEDALSFVHFLNENRRQALEKSSMLTKKILAECFDNISDQKETPKFRDFINTLKIIQQKLESSLDPKANIMPGNRHTPPQHNSLKSQEKQLLEVVNALIEASKITIPTKTVLIKSKVVITK